MDLSNKRDDHLPVYNIKAVSRIIGLLPVTLRAWERRYGLPHPGRGEQGYRLYSEHDLRTLRWLKKQIDSGWNIGRAVLYLTELRQAGQDPTMTSSLEPPSGPAAAAASPPLAGLSAELLGCLLQFDESKCGELLRRAFALYPVAQVLEEIVTPALVEIGERWHQGKIAIAHEHFASQLIMQHLMGMLAASAPPNRPGLIVAACAPGETHQIGLLILVVLLRWRGWDVKYLGPDLPLERLEESLGALRPSILMFSANRAETARALAGLPAVLARFRDPQPITVVGGQAFLAYRLPESLPVMYLPGAPSETVRSIENLMNEQTHTLRSPRFHRTVS